jgi:hypothetical protein
MIRFDIFGCVDWHTGMIFICIYYINYIIYIYAWLILIVYVYIYIRVTCCCRWQRYRVDKTRISTWVHHSGDGTNRATKPQMGSAFPGKWRVDIWLLDAVSTQLYLAMPVCQKTYFSICPLHCGFWEFWCWARVHEVENQPEAQTSARCTAATTFDMAVSAREVQCHFCNYSHWLDGIWWNIREGLVTCDSFVELPRVINFPWFQTNLPTSSNIINYINMQESARSVSCC